MSKANELIEKIKEGANSGKRESFFKPLLEQALVEVKAMGKKDRIDFFTKFNSIHSGGNEHLHRAGLDVEELTDMAIEYAFRGAVK